MRAGRPLVRSAADLAEALAEAEAPAHIYVIGGDPFLAHEAAASVRRLAGLEGEAGRLNLESLDGKDVAPAEALERLSTAPFLGPRRMCVVRRAEAWLAVAREAVLAYAADPPAHAVLVLLVDRIDDRNPVVAAAARRGVVAQLWPPYDAREAARWLAARARARGLRLSADGVQALLEAVGPDLAALASEVEKIKTLHGEAEVGGAEVEAAVGAYREADLEAYLSAVFRRDLAGSLDAVERSPSARREAVLWAAVAARRLRTLRRAVAMRRDGASAEKIGRALRLWGKRRIDETYAAAGRFGPVALERATRDLLRLDLALKGGEPAAHPARLERFAAGLCR